MSHKKALERFRALKIDRLESLQYYNPRNGLCCILGNVIPEFVTRLEQEAIDDRQRERFMSLNIDNVGDYVVFDDLLRESGLTLEESLALQVLNDQVCGTLSYLSTEEEPFVRAAAVEIYLEARDWEESNGLPVNLYLDPT